MTVLIVDDSLIIRQRLAESLGGIAGIEIIGEARGAWEALEMVEDSRPDFLTLDLRMPAGDGLTLLGELQKMETAPLVAVVTNFATAEYRKRCMELGAFAFLDKSSQIDELIVLVEKLRRESSRPELAP